MAEVKIIVGLGNPGKAYADTRHNIGFGVIDCLGVAMKTKVKKKKFGALFGEADFADNKLILLKPLSYMNRSGQVVATVMGHYRFVLSNLLVVLDDMALVIGRIRLRARGSAGGHKGLADIIEKVGTDEISRLRIGIGQSEHESAVDFVLDKAGKEEKPILDDAIETACEAVLWWVQYGIESSMDKFNARNQNS